MSEHDVRTTPWLLERTINIPLLGTIFMAVISGAVWASTINGRMQQVEDQVGPIAEMRVQVATIEERSAATTTTLARLERSVERLQDQDE